MNYFDQVYLKRMNKDGKNQQERIKTREEKEFDLLILQKTKYKSFIIQINEQSSDIQCSLQPDKNNESKILFKLMTSNSAAALKTGDILHIYQQVKDTKKEDIWIVLHVENDITKGYRLYTVLCLDEILNITDEHGNTIYSVPVKMVNSSQNWVSDTFQFSKTSYGYREPQGNRMFITQDFNFLKKGIYLNFKERGWEIVGIDNISINNVGYYTITERNVIPLEPIASDEIPISEEENFFLINTGDRYGVK